MRLFSVSIPTEYPSWGIIGAAGGRHHATTRLFQTKRAILVVQVSRVGDRERRKGPQGPPSKALSNRRISATTGRHSARRRESDGREISRSRQRGREHAIVGG